MFFTFLNVYVSWIEQDKILISVLSPPKSRYFADQNGPNGGPIENEFWQFSNTKINMTNRAQKVDDKNGIICLVFFFSSWVIVLNCQKKIMHFLQICADRSKKSNFINAIYLYPFERPQHALSEKIVFYMGLRNSSIVCIGVSPPPPQKHHPSLSCQVPPLNLETVQAPPF